MPPFNVSPGRLTLAALLASLAACKQGESAPAPAPPPPMEVGVAAVVAQDVTPADELTGRVEAIQRVDIRARATGFVTSVRYREGSEVAAGAVLFTIDPRPYQAAFARASAELARARARVELAHREAARAEKLLAASAIPIVERDTAVSLAAQAEAERAGAQASLELARLDLEFTQIRAPIAGRTGQALVSVGDYVAPGQHSLLTTVVSVDPVHVYFTSDERRYLQLSNATSREVAVGLADETGYPHAGKVDFVDNRLDAATGTIRLRAVVPNPDKRLVPGLYARVRLPEDRAVKAMLVDDKAIQTDQDRKYVYVLAGDTVARRDVTLGRILDGKRVIASGLKDGDRVIVANTQKVFPGAKATAAAAADARVSGGAP
jgi:multidrug efflux system membrane fusion protein